MTKPLRRRTYFIDQKVQGALLIRVTWYWLTSLFAVGSLTFIGWMFVFPGLGEQLVPNSDMAHAVLILVMALVSTALLLPVALLDLTRFSNRIAGPMYRMRLAMKQLADGESIDPIELRKGDYWEEFADAFNELQSRLEGPSELSGLAQEDSASTDSCTGCAPIVMENPVFPTAVSG